MKLSVEIHKATKTKKSMDISLADGGFIRLMGGSLSIGYTDGTGRTMELMVDADDVKALLASADK